VTLFPIGYASEFHAKLLPNLRDDPGDDELFFSRGFHGREKVRIVPGVDVPGTGDVGGVGEGLLPFGDPRSVGPCSKLVVRMVGNPKPDVGPVQVTVPRLHPQNTPTLWNRASTHLFVTNTPSGNYTLSLSMRFHLPELLGEGFV
jgi:hypothetical protein